MRIGELAATTGTTAKTLQFYEQQGLLPAPARTAAGYRDFPPEMADRIGFIRAAQACGLTRHRSARSWRYATPALRPAVTSSN